VDDESTGVSRRAGSAGLGGYTFRLRLRPGCSRRNLHHVDAGHGEYGVERATEPGVAIADQEPELVRAVGQTAASGAGVQVGVALAGGPPRESACQLNIDAAL
jgi:hypothetical protein